MSRYNRVNSKSTQRLSNKLTRSLEHDDDNYYMNIRNALPERNIANTHDNLPSRQAFELFDDYDNTSYNGQTKSHYSEPATSKLVASSNETTLVVANRSRDVNITHDNLQQALLNQLLTKTDNDDDLSMTKYSNKKKNDDKPIKIYPVDVYLLLDSKYRNPQYDINDKFTYNVTVNSPANVAGNISINYPLSNIIEMEILGDIKIPISENIYEQYAQQTFNEAVMEIPELTAQSFTEYGNKKFHFTFNISQMENKYILSPKISKFIFTKPIKTDSLTLNFRFPYDKFNFINDVIEGQIEYPKILQAFKLNDLLDVVNGMIIVDNYLIAYGRGPNGVVMVSRSILTPNNSMWRACACITDNTFLEITYITDDYINNTNNSKLFIVAGKNSQNIVTIRDACIINDKQLLYNNLSNFYNIGNNVGFVKKIELFTNGSIKFLFVICKKKTINDPCVYYIKVTTVNSNLYLQEPWYTVNFNSAESSITSCNSITLLPNSTILLGLDVLQISPCFYNDSIMTGVNGPHVFNPLNNLGLPNNSVNNPLYYMNKVSSVISYNFGTTILNYIFGEKSTNGATLVVIDTTSSTINSGVVNTVSLTSVLVNNIEINRIISLSNVSVIRELTVNSVKYIELAGIAYGVTDGGSKNIYCPVKIILSSNSGTITKLGNIRFQDSPSSLVYKQLSDSNGLLFLSTYTINNNLHQVFAYNGFINSATNTTGNYFYRWYVLGNKNFKLCKFLSSKKIQPVGFSNFLTEIDTIYSIFCHNNIWLIGGATATWQEVYFSGQNPLLCYSDDNGKTWNPTTVTLSTLGLYNTSDIVFNNGIYHAVINSYSYKGITLLYSLDGKLWNPIIITGLPITTSFYTFLSNAVAYNNGLWICVGYNQDSYNIVTSTDGIIWNAIKSSLLSDHNDVDYDKNDKLWYIVGGYGGSKMIVSPDAKNWSPIPTYFYSSNGTSSYPNSDKIGIKKLYITDTYSLGIFTFYTGDSSIPDYYLIGSSFDKRNWTINDITINNPDKIPPTLFWDGQIWTLNLYGINGGVYTSIDGKVWNCVINSQTNGFNYCKTGGKILTDPLNFITSSSHKLTNNDYVSVENISNDYINYNYAHRPIDIIDDNILAFNANLSDLLYNTIVRPCDYDSINYTSIKATIYTATNVNNPGYLTLELLNTSFLNKGDKCTIINFFGIDNDIFTPDSNGNYKSFEITDISSINSRITIYSPLFTTSVLSTLKLMEDQIYFHMAISNDIIQSYNNSQKIASLRIGTRSVRIPMRFRCLTTAPTNYITPV